MTQTTAIPDRLLLTIHEAAEVGRMSVSTLRRRLRRGSFPEPRKALGKGSRALWHRKDIEKWVEKRERK